MADNKKIYDLEERTAKFGENIIEFAKKIPQNVITKTIINQLVRAGTVWDQIIAKRTARNQERTLNIKWE
jgi:hypothetical protein